MEDQERIESTEEEDVEGHRAKRVPLASEDAPRDEAEGDDDVELHKHRRAL